MALAVKEHNLGGFPDVKLLAYWQHQSNGNNCGPFSLAMATNLRTGSTLLDGNTVEKIMEAKGWKLKGFGVPAWYGYEKALMMFNPGAVVTRYKGASFDDLKQALAADKICIVEVSWQTDSEILKMFFTGGKLTVGHYMVAVGFNTNGFYFLDPGFDLDKGTNRLQFYFYSDFEQIWLKQPNVFIPPGTLFTMNNR
jgi:hypothetical protein